MKILVLGGCGIQGRAAVYDLANSPGIREIICADGNLDGFNSIKPYVDTTKIRLQSFDAADVNSLEDLIGQADAAIDLLPRHHMKSVCEMAVKARVPAVFTNYAYPVADLDDRAKASGVALMPESGLDPGIDLVIYGMAKQRFQELHVINSYCGGIPEKSACDNPLNYKVSWTWEGVLSSTKRDSRIIKDGREVFIPGDRQHESEFVGEIEFPGLGPLETIPNGDAVFFTDLLGVTATIKETGRYSLRWPGWSAFWQPLKRLGFLNEEPVTSLPCEVSPYTFMDKFLEPRLQYKDDEKDLVVMVNVFEGISEGEKIRLTSRLLIERDLDTGLMAMSKGVGFTASIVAQMIASGEISEKGILSPMVHVPYRSFLDRLAQRGIKIEEETTVLY